MTIEIVDAESDGPASAWLSHWHETTGASAHLINLSENHTFRVTGPAGTFILRQHRPGYQSEVAIRSELAWLSALRADSGLEVPNPLPGRDGDLLQTWDRGGQGRLFAVLFETLPGREARDGDDLGQVFHRLGRIAATCHHHALGWRQPNIFLRPEWTAETMLDPGGLWGDWRAAPGVDSAAAGVLTRLEARLRADLAAYGRGPDRFGLIHADMRLANVLVDGARLRVIDFDDCGFGWFIYDFAAAVSFIETSPHVPDLKEAWLRGYGETRRLGAEHVGMLDAMIMLRRMVLLAWVGSHAETELARSYAPTFADGTVTLAERYLGSTRPG